MDQIQNLCYLLLDLYMVFIGTVISEYRLINSIDFFHDFRFLMHSYHQQIGTFSIDDQLTISSSYKPSWDGSCERPGSCSECPTVRNTLTRYMQQAATSDNAATLVALLNIHRQGSDAYRCGSLNMHALNLALSFFFTIETLSPRPYQVRGLVLDFCSNPLRIDRDMYSLLSTGKLCNTGFDADGIINNNTIAGAFTFSSSSTVAANRVLSPMKVPILSGSATSDLLSDKSNYPYFARTIEPDDTTMKAIAAILKSKDWTYVSAVYSRESYGISAVAKLQEVLKSTGGCIGLSVGVDYPTTPDQAKAAVQSLIATAGANVIVLVTLTPRQILLAAKELGVLDRFIFIGTDTWGNDLSVSAGMEPQLLGSIILSPRSAVVDQFRTYIRAITYSNRKNIPKHWFEEFYQTMHKCQLKDSENPQTKYSVCTKNEVITNGMIQDYPYIINTIAATYSAMAGLNTMASGRCTLQSTFKDCFSDSTNWDRYFNEILKVQWKMQDALTLKPAESFDLSYNDDRYWNIGFFIYTLMQNNNKNYYIGKVSLYLF